MAGNSAENNPEIALKAYHSSLYKRSLKADTCWPKHSYYWSCWKTLQRSVGLTVTAAGEQNSFEEGSDLLHIQSVANKKVVDEGSTKKKERKASVILFGKKHVSGKLIKNINACCKDLERAASNGHSICVEWLLESGADVNKIGQHQTVALISAVKRGHYEIMKTLINAGADVNMAGFMKETALVAAASIGHESCLQLLLDKGADVNTVNSYQNTALQVAARNLHCGCVAKLIGVGADLSGLTPLMFAVVSSKLVSLSVRNQLALVNTIELLVSAGADVNGRDVNGQTVVMMGAKWQKLEFLKFLTTKGADVNLFDDNGDSALSIAVNSHGNYEIVKHLLQAGAYVNCNTLNINEEDEDLETLLFAAGERENIFLLTEFEYSRKSYPENVNFDYCVESMKSMCRGVIRNQLYIVSPTENLLWRVTLLGLPSSLAAYLIFHVL